MNSGKLTFDGLTGTDFLTAAISETDLQKIQLLAHQTILSEGRPQEVQILVANKHSERPNATAELQFKLGTSKLKTIQ